MKQRFLIPSILLAALWMTGDGGAATLTGLWLFDNGANPGQATVGNNLVFEGTAPTYSASIADEGATSLTGVITTAAAVSTNRIRADHGIGANGGGLFVNQYTIVADIFSPAASRGAWRTIFQTSTANGNDGEYFIRPDNDNLGSAELTYTGSPINETLWSRLVLTFDLTLAGGDAQAYLDGGLHYSHTGNLIVDGRYALDPFLYFFTDNDGDNAPLNVGALAIYDGILTPLEVSALGRAGTAIPIPEPSAFAFVGLAVLAGLRRRR